MCVHVQFMRAQADRRAPACVHACAKATDFLVKHKLLSAGFAAVHWRSEKVHLTGPGARMWGDMRAAGDKIIAAIARVLKECKLAKVFLAVDFLSHGTQSRADATSTAGARRQAGLMEQHRRILEAFDVVTFSPAEDFPVAFKASNAMALAAAELTIISRASVIVPVVRSGFFLDTAISESSRPVMTAQAALSRAAKCSVSGILGGIKW